MKVPSGFCGLGFGYSMCVALLWLAGCVNHKGLMRWKAAGFYRGKALGSNDLMRSVTMLTFVNKLLGNARFSTRQFRLTNDNILPRTAFRFYEVFCASIRHRGW